MDIKPEWQVLGDIITLAALNKLSKQVGLEGGRAVMADAWGAAHRDGSATAGGPASCSGSRVLQAAPHRVPQVGQLAVKAGRCRCWPCLVPNLPHANP